MIFDKQDKMNYDFVDFNGNKWCLQFVDVYNLFTNDINKSAGFEVASDSLTMRERDYFLDNRHKHFMNYMQLSK